MSKLINLLPNKDHPRVNAQALIPRDLYARADHFRKLNQWTWPQVMTAMFQHFCDEIGKREASQEKKESA